MSASDLYGNVDYARLAQALVNAPAPIPVAISSDYANISITGFDLSNSDWVLSAEEGELATIPGSNEIGIFVESSDDEQFQVAVQFKDSNNNVLGQVDSNINSNLTSSSPTNGNHFVYVTVDVAYNIVDIVITDVSNNSPNNIDGAINAH